MPELCELKNTILPDGLIYINDFIDEIYAKEISDFIMNDAYKGKIPYLQLITQFL